MSVTLRELEVPPVDLFQPYVCCLKGMLFSEHGGNPVGCEYILLFVELRCLPYVAVMMGSHSL